MEFANKAKSQTNEQNQPESEEELQSGEAVNLVLKYVNIKFNHMQSQLAENLRPPLSKRLRETVYNFKCIGNKKQFNFIST